jgi:TalC/MipB family fructose-6-phosphate aldolase
MKIWLDSINDVTIKHAADLGILAGVTTNPTILSRSTQDFEYVIGSILDSQPGKLAVQVVQKDYESIVKQAKKLAAISDRIIVKIPAVQDGFRAIATLERDNIATLATTIFESRQIIAAALCGASYAAPYVNRIEVATGQAFEILGESQRIIDAYGLKIKIMAAAIKSVEQFVRCAKLGVPAVTLPDDIYNALFVSNENIVNSLHQFDLAWASNERMRESSFFVLD